MQNRVKEYIELEKLFKPNYKIIVGFSGGSDSVVLLHLLTSLGYNCIAAHCNFHLREEESNRDANFCKTFCNSLGVKYLEIDFDTFEYASKKGISIEMAARDLRYEWFEKVRVDEGADAISVAHHLDDSVETILLNLTRGTGIKGLTGIPPKNGYVRRPLLSVSSQDIKNYIKATDLQYVDDSTNSEEIYRRNFIRLRVLPLLKEINPSVEKAIMRTAKNLRDTEEVYKSSINQEIEKVLLNDKIDISILKQTSFPETILYEILYPIGFNPTAIKDLYNSINSISGKSFHSSKYKLIKDREYILIIKKEDTGACETFEINIDTEEITQPVSLTIRRENATKEFIIKREKKLLYVDEDKLTFPLTLRHWKRGDWFIPFGMKGRKKVSDYFSDNKYNLQEKQDAWLLCSGDEIVWIVGERSDNRFAINENTKNIYKIEYTV